MLWFEGLGLDAHARILGFIIPTQGTHIPLPVVSGADHGLRCSFATPLGFNTLELDWVEGLGRRVKGSGVDTPGSLAPKFTAEAAQPHKRC